MNDSITLTIIMRRSKLQMIRWEEIQKPGVVKTCGIDIEYVNGDMDWVDDDGWMQENDVYPPPEHHHIEEPEIHYHKK